MKIELFQKLHWYFRSLVLTLALFFYSLLGYSRQPVFVCTGVGNLYSLNLSNCTARFVGNTGHIFGDIAFTPDGRLWGFGGNSNSLYLIDTTNVSTTFVGNYSQGGAALEGLNDSTLLINTYYCDLVKINNKTATTMSLGNMGFCPYGDFVWQDNYLYMSATGPLSIVKFGLNTSNTIIVSTNTISTSNQLTYYGLASVLLGNNKTLIGFSGSSAFTICELNGGINLLCPSIIPNLPNGSIDEIRGSASMKLPASHSPSIACYLPTGINKNTQKQKGFEIYPNPVNKSGVLTIKNLPDNSTFTEIKIFNLQGKEIISKTESANLFQFDLKHYNLSGGIYFIEITSSNQRSYSKIIVE